MYSTVSENPTRARDDGRWGDESESAWNMLKFSEEPDTLMAGGVWVLGKGEGFNSLSTGVAGVLSIRGISGTLEVLGVLVDGA